MLQPNETETSSVVGEIIEGLCCADEVLLWDCSVAAIWLPWSWS